MPKCQWKKNTTWKFHSKRSSSQYNCYKVIAGQNTQNIERLHQIVVNLCWMCRFTCTHTYIYKLYLKHLAVSNRNENVHRWYKIIIYIRINIIIELFVHIWSTETWYANWNKVCILPLKLKLFVACACAQHDGVQENERTWTHLTIT